MKFLEYNAWLCTKHLPNAQELNLSQGVEGIEIEKQTGITFSSQ